MLTVQIARNEYECFQVIANGPIQIFNISIEASSTIQFQIHRAAYLNISNVSDCDGSVGFYPDALIPDTDVFVGEKRKVFPILVSATQSRSFWVDLFAHPEILSGNYTLYKLSVHEFRIVLQLQVEVFRFALPSTSSFATAFGVYWTGILKGFYGSTWQQHGNESVVHTQRYADLALMHRVTLSNMLASDWGTLSQPSIDWSFFFFALEIFHCRARSAVGSTQCFRVHF